MSAAVRPVTEVKHLLDVLQTSLVAAMLKPAYDPLQPQLENWVCRRRAARMALQACGHVRWAIGQASCFLRYWGHAARYTVFDWRPITRILAYRDSDWLEDHPHVKRKPGYWPDAVRWIQLAWQSVGHLGNWLHQASDREGWKAFIDQWIASKFPHPTGFFQELQYVDLLGRSLLHVGDRFWLLPMKHQLKLPTKRHTGTSQHLLRRMPNHAYECLPTAVRKTM